MISLPPNGCAPLSVSPPPFSTRLWIVLMERGDCKFLTKVLNAQKAGFGAAIVYNVGSNSIRECRVWLD